MKSVSNFVFKGTTNQYFFWMNQMAGKHPGDLVSRKHFKNYSYNTIQYIL